MIDATSLGKRKKKKAKYVCKHIWNDIINTSIAPSMRKITRQK